jgi:hypothetical protein
MGQWCGYGHGAWSWRRDWQFSLGTHGAGDVAGDRMMHSEGRDVIHDAGPEPRAGGTTSDTSMEPGTGDVPVPMGE